MSKDQTPTVSGKGPERVQSVQWSRSPEVKAWLTHNITTQERRYQKIVEAMEKLAPERERWVAEFLDIIQTRGFTVTGDTRRVIPAAEVPTQPKRDHTVVF